MNWIQDSIKIGLSKVGIRRIIKFQAVGTLPEIRKIASSCGCSQPTYISESNSIEVAYKPNPIPKHLRGKQSFYNSTKTITVYYVDGTKDVLTFSSKVIK